MENVELKENTLNIQSFKEFADGHGKQEHKEPEQDPIDEAAPKVKATNPLVVDNTGRIGKPAIINGKEDKQSVVLNNKGTLIMKKMLGAYYFHNVDPYDKGGRLDVKTSFHVSPAEFKNMKKYI